MRTGGQFLNIRRIEDRALRELVCMVLHWRRIRNEVLVCLISECEQLGQRTTFDSQPTDSKPYWAYLRGLECGISDLAEPCAPGYEDVQEQLMLKSSALQKQHRKNQESHNQK